MPRTISCMKGGALRRTQPLLNVHIKIENINDQCHVFLNRFILYIPDWLHTANRRWRINCISCFQTSTKQKSQNATSNVKVLTILEYTDSTVYTMSPAVSTMLIFFRRCWLERRYIQVVPWSTGMILSKDFISSHWQNKEYRELLYYSNVCLTPAN